MVTIPKSFAYFFAFVAVLAIIGTVSEIREHNRICLEAGIARIPSPGENPGNIFPDFPGESPDRETLKPR